MSDYLAVGGVSAVLKSMLSSALSDGGPSSVLVSPPGITIKAPDLITTGADEPPQLNLFMYYASINPALRNLGLPSANASGTPTGNPPLAINLHYLVTAYGGNAFDPEILLAFAMQVFHSTPVVPRDVIQAALTDLATGSPSNEQKLVAASNLASQIEQIKITPEALTTEEIYRLWTAFQTNYRPTTSYQVSVVVIQDSKSFKSNLPVQRRSLLALPLIGPVVDAVSPSMAVSGQILTITGSNFLGDSAALTQVSFDGGDPVAAATVQGDCVRVALPAALLAGTHTVRVLRGTVFPSSTRVHPGFSSNPVPFQLVPTIPPAITPPFQAHQANPFVLTVSPQVGNLQQAVVYIGDQALPQPPSPLTGPSLSSTVTVDIPATFAAGTYPLRVEVDGAQSKLALDSNSGSPTFGQWLPQVQVGP
ncbi:MAG TPA: DUF4255 domain-containing protein [Fibrobacteria bacterium]|nr:DUF4255 domain-containing protein [Fibrobacteria bacterium]